MDPIAASRMQHAGRRRLTAAAMPPLPVLTDCCALACRNMQWHLGSFSDRGVDSPDCYPIPASGPHNGTCQSGYWHGSETAAAASASTIRPQSRTRSTSASMSLSPRRSVPPPPPPPTAAASSGPPPPTTTRHMCELGHYNHPHDDPTSPSRDASFAPYLECMQYYAGNYSHGSAPTGGASRDSIRNSLDRLAVF